MALSRLEWVCHFVYCSCDENSVFVRGDELVDGSRPGLVRGLVHLRDRLSKAIESSFLAYRLQGRPSDLDDLAQSPVHGFDDVGQAVSHHMNNAELHLGRRVYRRRLLG